MGYDLYFINETKRQLVSAKKTDAAGLEDGTALVRYLSTCKGDTIRIVGEEDPFIERELLADAPTYVSLDLRDYDA